MRVFIAIKLPKKAQEDISLIQEELKERKERITWVEPKNIHLTLKFIGEVSTDKIEEIIKATENALFKKTYFNIAIAGLGAFPSINQPKVIWIGTKEGNEDIISLVKAIEEELEEIGIAKGKRVFSSHITLGRVKSLIDRTKLAFRIKEVNIKYCDKRITFNVDKITIFKSILTNSGPIYEALKEINLKTA
ncbi:MAG: RNA 2',3'-cyclic phosphodiesterase [Candidatus Omnitrophota bacterium]